MVWQPEALEIRILKALASHLDAIEKDILREKNRHEKSSINPSSQTIPGVGPGAIVISGV
jgi:hypothetical protein